jgi:hypothetical protein
MGRSTAVGICVAVGILWAARTGLAIGDPDDRDPSTLHDWLAVLTLSAAFASMAPGMLALGTLAEPTTWFRTAAGAVAVSALVAAVGNLLDNAVQTRSGALIWALGAAGVFAGLVALVFALLAERPRALARVPILSVVGIATVEVGGGLLLLAVWAWLAVRVHEGPAG